MFSMIRSFPGRRWIFSIVVAGAVLALFYVGAEFAFDWAERNRMGDLRQEKIAAAGKWVIEEGISNRFDGRPFIMASTNSALIYGDQFYDLSLICYGPGEAGASLLVLVYRVAIIPGGLGAYPLGAGDRVELVMKGGRSGQSLTLEYDAASDALETRLSRDGRDIPKMMFGGHYGKENPLVVRGMGGDVAFVDGTASENLARGRVLDACPPGNLAK
jgi:hypothetical protein